MAEKLPTAAMFDLHNHLLPGTDDGPADMEESIEMARMAYEDGTRVIVATPHGKDVVEKSSIPAVRALVDRLNHEIADRFIPLRILLGMENHLEPNTPDLVDNGLAIPIEGTHYILIELPFQSYPLYVDNVLFQVQIKGLRPIIVHPERNTRIQDSPETLAGLVQRGAIAQLTASSITGAFGKDAQSSSRELLQRGLVHIIASDGHTAGGKRDPILSIGVVGAARIIGEEAALRMVTDTPQSILQDELIDTEVRSGSSRKSWWPFRR